MIGRIGQSGTKVVQEKVRVGTELVDRFEVNSPDPSVSRDCATLQPWLFESFPLREATQPHIEAS